MSSRGRSRGRGRGRGRGAYYAAKYGGRGRGGRGGHGSFDGEREGDTRGSRGWRRDPEQFTYKGDVDALWSFLESLDGAQYPAYKGLIAEWRLAKDISLFVDRVQSDPYAPPSRARVRVPMSAAGFPEKLFDAKIRETAFCDFLTRKFWRVAHGRGMDRRAPNAGWGGAKGGDLSIDRPGQHVLRRTSCLLVEDKFFIELRFVVNLPAQGRRIQGREAARILGETLVRVVEESLFAQEDDSEALSMHVQSVEDQEYLRSEALRDQGLIGFVANGAILPRASGADDYPMDASKAVKFRSPPNLEVSVTLPSGRSVSGMGIRPGISLIVGGGFHGKSTLLSALELGVYNHVPGDGREFVVVDPNTMSIRAEDGRSVSGVDITPFINNLPFGKKTDSFSTADASGSTSQSASICEALEAGAKVLLTDEDLAATNFMIRDSRMQALVPSSKEPITPMIERIRALYEEEGVSSILVIGGTGEYFDVSDTVIQMEDYQPRDVTEQAKKIAKESPSGLCLNIKKNSPAGIFKKRKKRKLATASIRKVGNSGKGRISVKLKGLVQFGDTDLDVSALPQIAEISQTRAIAAVIETVGALSAMEDEGLSACVEKVCVEIERGGLDTINQRGELLGNYACPRRLEVEAALNRLRGISMLN